MQNSKISFTSGIKITDSYGFFQEMRKFKSKTCVDWPWTANEIIKTSQGYTDRIKTCTAGGIITKNNQGNGLDVVMFHIDPDERKNFDFKTVEKTILDKLGEAKPLQGLLFGSKNLVESSVEMFDRFESFFKEKLGITYSKFKGIPLGGHSGGIGFNGEKDEWIISSTNIKTVVPDILKKEIPNYFNEIVISDKDQLIF